MNRRTFLKDFYISTLALPALLKTDLLAYNKNSDTKNMPGSNFPSNRLLGEGTKISITPDKVRSESYNTFKFKIRIGKQGLSKNDSMGIVCGSNIDRWQFVWPDQMWGNECPWQTQNPKKEGYITAECRNRNAEISLKVGKLGGFKPYRNQKTHFVRALKERLRYVLEIYSDKDLTEGDEIIVTWGNKKHGSPGVKAPVTAFSYYFLPFQYSLLPDTDPELPIRRGNYKTLPAIKVIGKKAAKFYVTAQPFVQKNHQFKIQISALDEYFHLDENFTGKIKLTITSENYSKNHSVSISAKNKGVVVINDISINKAGWFKIKTESGSIKGYSNYIIVTDKAPKHKLYFGDMHLHTLDCDATIPLEAHFNYALKAAGFDFISVSPHAEYLGSKQAWENYLEKTEYYNTPSSFVTFFGYEWAGDGHCNAYFLKKEDARLFYNPRLIKNPAEPTPQASPTWSSSIPEDNPEFRSPIPVPGTREPKKPGSPYFKKGIVDFMKAIEKLKVPAFVIGHCHTRYRFSDDNVLWLYEIHSTHQMDGREEKFRRFLRAGKYFGVCGGSDNHRLPAGHPMKEPGKKWPNPFVPDICYHTAGLQATFANKLNRSSLYNAMKLRHTYGTDGERIILVFESNGNIMGDKVVLVKNQKPEFNIKIGGTDEISEIILWKYNGQEWLKAVEKKNLNVDRWTGSWKEEKPVDSAIYYLVIKQKNGAKAWSSPIWFERKS